MTFKNLLSLYVAKIRWVFHPVVIFIFAQISLGLLLSVWIYWYITRSREWDNLALHGGQWSAVATRIGLGSGLILAQGCLLITVILIALYIIFVNFQKQKSLNKMQDALFNNITHELKTPLASMRLCTETILLRDLSTADRNKFLTRSLGEADRLQHLIESILLSARLESHGVKDAIETLDLRVIALQCWEKFIERFGEVRTFQLGNTTLQEGNKDEFLMKGNNQQLTMLFDNLLTNAVKYSNPGGLIKLDFNSENGWIFATVSNEGKGIPKSELKRVFHKFYRVDSTQEGARQSSGLGLYLCKNIVKGHNGLIKAHSAGPGKGASFEVGFVGYSSAYFTH